MIRKIILILSLNMPSAVLSIHNKDLEQLAINFDKKYEKKIQELRNQLNEANKKFEKLNNESSLQTAKWVSSGLYASLYIWIAGFVVGVWVTTPSKGKNK